MVYTLDPLTDRRWDDLVERHPSASIFHSRPWLTAVQRTYGYRPIAYSTSAPSSPLDNAIVFCEIDSWLTGRRLVSVPFSDHCDPLLDDASSAAAIATELKRAVEAGRWKYVELRPASETAHFEGGMLLPKCILHVLDLRPTQGEILRRTHQKSVQQPIRRAEREDLVYESGNSDRLLAAFYRLMVQTRRRHKVPPQPIQWFRNLINCMGGRLQIRVAYKNRTEVAGIITLRNKGDVVYKYGASDAAFQNLGATPFLLWKAISEEKSTGAVRMDFGRSDADNQGLIQFKTRWGAQPREITYFRWSRKPLADEGKRRSSRFMKQVFAVMPDAVLKATGRLLYRHVG